MTTQEINFFHNSSKLQMFSILSYVLSSNGKNWIDEAKYISEKTDLTKLIEQKEEEALMICYSLKYHKEYTAEKLMYLDWLQDKTIEDVKWILAIGMEYGYISSRKNTKNITVFYPTQKGIKKYEQDFQ